MTISKCDHSYETTHSEWGLASCNVNYIQWSFSFPLSESHFPRWYPFIHFIFYSVFCLLYNLWTQNGAHGSFCWDWSNRMVRIMAFCWLLASYSFIVWSWKWTFPQPGWHFILRTHLVCWLKPSFSSLFPFFSKWLACEARGEVAVAMQFEFDHGLGCQNVFMSDLSFNKYTMGQSCSSLSSNDCCIYKIWPWKHTITLAVGSMQIFFQFLGFFQNFQRIRIVFLNLGNLEHSAWLRIPVIWLNGQH